ncbi:MAG: GAF domain-containing protein [Candidatus Heimdallarchaeota archaeon]
MEATLKDRSYELEVLNKVISAGYIARNMDELLDFTLTTVLNSLDFNGGAIYFVNEENSKAELHRSLGFSNAFIESAKTLPIKSKTFRKLFIDGKTIFAEDYMGRSEGHKETGIKTLIGVPFFSKQKVIGGLILSLKEKRVILKDDLATLEAIGREVGTAVAKMQGEEELLASQKNLQTIFDAMYDFFIVFDSETGAILNVNKIAQEKLGYTIKELQKMSFFDLSIKGKKKELESIIKRVISGKIKNSFLILEGKSGKKNEDNFVFYNAKFTKRKVVIARCS